jgi:RES domain-containing protein
MKLWRLTRAPFVALDGEGAFRNGSRYAPPGRRVASLASEAGLAVLVVLRYLPRDLQGISDDYVLGWTTVDATPIRIPDDRGEEAIRSCVGDWLDSRSSLLAAVRSKVLPEADVVLLNPEHPKADQVPPLVTRPFDFAECLHTPPMLTNFTDANSRDRPKR